MINMKKQAMFCRMIVHSLVRRRSRMLVALLAIAVGATVLSGLTTIYYDIPRQMGQEFRSYGANLILLPTEDEATLDETAIQKAQQLLPADSVVGLSPYRYESVKINEQPFLAAGSDMEQIKKTSPYWHVTGEWPQNPGEVLVGQEAADLIRLSPGRTFTITGTNSAGESFQMNGTVSGILQTGGTEEGFLVMAIEDLEKAMGDSGKYHLVECSISASTAELQSIATQMEQYSDDVVPRLVKRVVQSEGTVLTKLQALVYLVNVVVLLLTMICVATTMMAVVAERRKEIGLKKALGAANRSIVTEFLGEGLFLGLLGGLLGVVMGFFFAQSISVNVFGRAIAFQPLLIPITLLASVVITGIACLIPVRGTLDVDPAIVLRGE